MLGNVKKLLGRLHRDEQGAEGLEKLLIIAAIVLPLLGVLLFFREDISKWVGDLWESWRGQSNQAPYTPPPIR